MYLNIPFLLMIFLTFIVWVCLYVNRLSWILKNKIDPQKFALRSQRGAMPSRAQNISDNFQNLFELPVIFYVLLLYLAWGNEFGQMDIVLAYIFVIGRYVHSLIHCTYNKVTHRFAAYMISAIALWIMFLDTIWGLFFV